MGILFIKLRLFPQSPLHLKHNFSVFGETLYAGRVKPLPEPSEFITHAVSHLVVIRKTASSEWFLQGPKRVAVGGCKMETRENIPPRGLALSCRIRPWFIFLFGRTLTVRCYNSCNVRTCRCAVTVAPLFKNYINRTPALSHKTPAIALTAQGRTFEFVLT